MTRSGSPGSPSAPRSWRRAAPSTRSAAGPSSRSSPRRRSASSGEAEAKNVAAEMGLYDDPRARRLRRARSAHGSWPRRRGVTSPTRSTSSTWRSRTRSRCPAATSTSRAGSSRSPTTRTSWPASSGTRSATWPRSTRCGACRARRRWRSRRASAPRSPASSARCSGSVVGGVGGLAGALVLAPYSRGQEHEADRVGQEMAARAGWDPAGISRSLHTLEREEALHGNDAARHVVLRDAPAAPASRRRTTEERARGLERGNGRRALRQRRSRSCAVSTACRSGRAPPTGSSTGALFLHPVLGFHIRFPAGWKTANERSIVGAVAPDRGAAIGLELVGTRRRSRGAAARPSSRRRGRRSRGRGADHASGASRPCAPPPSRARGTGPIAARSHLDRVRRPASIA